jgi:hypothetical protein
MISSVNSDGEGRLSKWKAALASLLLFLFSAMVCLGLLEIVLRIQVRKPVLNQVTDRPSNFYLPQNALSMRGNLPEDIQRSADRFRIATIGDSFTFGPGLQLYDTYPLRLEWLLNLGEREKKIDVVSYGTPGFNTEKEFFLVKQALENGANVVVLEITLNDAQAERMVKALPAFTPPKALSFLGHSKLYMFIRQRIFNSQSVRRYIDYHLNLFEDPATYGVFVSSIDKMQELCRERNVPFVAVLFPLFDFPIDQKYPFQSLHEKIGGVMKERNIPLLDLKESYQDIDPIRLQLIPGKDSHPNEIGHRIAAEEIYSWLLNRNILPPINYTSRVYKKRSGVYEGRQRPHKGGRARRSLRQGH